MTYVYSLLYVFPLLLFFNVTVFKIFVLMFIMQYTGKVLTSSTDKKIVHQNYN